MSQIAADTVKLVAEIPDPDHGDTVDNPTPAPRARSIRPMLTVTNAPAATAAHETADFDDSDAPSRDEILGRSDGFCDAIDTEISKAA
jgi:hypothetical protein